MQHEDIQAHQRLRQCFGRDLGHEASVNICNLSLCRKKTKQKNINTRDVAATSLRLVEAPPTEATVSHGDRTSRNSQPLDLWGAGIASTEQTRLLPPVLQRDALAFEERGPKHPTTDAPKATARPAASRPAPKETTGCAFKFSEKFWACTGKRASRDDELAGYAKDGTKSLDRSAGI